VDTRDIVRTLFGGRGTTSGAVKFFVVMNESGTEIQPEGMLNLNAGLIMTTCFMFAWISGKMRATTSMVVGTLFASCALFLSGYSTYGWLSVAAILTFSVGEMLSSPKFSEFIGNFAPSDKKAMYLGFSQIPLAIGWGFEGFTAPALYDHFSSKDRFAREALLQHGLNQSQVDAIKQGEAFKELMKVTGDSREHLTDILYQSHNIGLVWVIMGVIGVITAFGIYLYGRWIYRLVKK
jgi:proton-dependent oligopeptide transporter, POT family